MPMTDDTLGSGLYRRNGHGCHDLKTNNSQKVWVIGGIINVILIVSHWEPSVAMETNFAPKPNSQSQYGSHKI